MSTIRIDVTHVGLGMEFRELAFSNDMTLATMKNKLYPKTGTEPSCMKFTLVDHVSGSRTAMNGDDATLDSFGLINGSRLEVEDTNDNSVSNNLFAEKEEEKPVQKYEAKKGDSGFAQFRKDAVAKFAGKNQAVAAENKGEGADADAEAGATSTAGREDEL